MKTKNQNNNGMTQYYTMDETFLMQAANTLLNPVINEMVENFERRNKPFTDGEVMCFICEGRTSWMSSSRESLVAIMQNKKKPMYYMDFDI